MTIRSFIYMDTDKLRSASSQIFEGVTERIIQSKEASSSEETRQKGEFNSGRILADIFSHQDSFSEMKFLADHAFSIFEKGLTQSDRLVDLSSCSIDGDLNEIVRVTGHCCLNDMKSSINMLKKFNEYGVALWRTQNEGMDSGSPISSDKDARRKAAEMGLQINEKVASAAAEVINFGFGETFEIFLTLDSFEVSAPLKREFLREREDILVQKYTRLPERPLTIMGFVAQRPNSKGAAKVPDVKEASNPKMAMRYLAMHLSNVESEYSKASGREFVIDPIAAYFEY